MEKQRCKWVNLKNDKYIKYHDEIWGRRIDGDKELFEALILEIFSGGLSFECVLNKKEDFSLALDNYDIDKIINYDEKKIDELLNNKNIIRNKGKIKSLPTNAKIFKEIVNEYGSFYTYLERNNCVSDLLKDLKSRGMRYVGDTTISSLLEAVGVINAHETSCFLYKNNESSY